MQTVDTRHESPARKQRHWLPLTLVSLLTILLLIFGTVSTANGQPSEPETIEVPVALLRRSAAAIDSLKAHIAVQDTLIVAQRDYYIELLEIKDVHTETLQEIIKDLRGNGARDMLDKVLWGGLGYAIRAATE